MDPPRREGSHGESQRRFDKRPLQARQRPRRQLEQGGEVVLECLERMRPCWPCRAGKPASEREGCEQKQPDPQHYPKAAQKRKPAIQRALPPALNRKTAGLIRKQGHSQEKSEGRDEREGVMFNPGGNRKERENHRDPAQTQADHGPPSLHLSLG